MTDKLLWKELTDEESQQLIGGNWSSAFDGFVFLADSNGDGSLQDEFARNVPFSIASDPKWVGKVPSVDDPKYVEITQSPFGFELARVRYEVQTSNRGATTFRLIPLSA